MLSRVAGKVKGCTGAKHSSRSSRDEELKPLSRDCISRASCVPCFSYQLISSHASLLCAAMTPSTASRSAAAVRKPSERGTGGRRDAIPADCMRGREGAVRTSRKDSGRFVPIFQNPSLFLVSTHCVCWFLMPSNTILGVQTDEMSCKPRHDTFCSACRSAWRW